MSDFEVPEPIINSPYVEPQAHWVLKPGVPAVRAPGRREAGYFYRDPRAAVGDDTQGARGEWRALGLVNLVRERMAAWRAQGRPGLTRVSAELIAWWTRDGRQTRLFFAQVEAAETVIFLKEARADFRQGLAVPRDEPSDERKAEGYAGFERLACKMATGSGKTTVMAMLAAWSILNKRADRGDARFSDVVLVVCPNVTIRNRLRELDPRLGEASIYRARDLVPARLMPDLAHGRVVITNWHVFEPQGLQVGGVAARVTKQGQRTLVSATVNIGAKTTSGRGGQYMTREVLEARVASGDLRVLGEDRDEHGNLRKVRVEAERWIESDTALINRILGREVGGKQNILVLNDEAHHAYRIRVAGDDDQGDDDDDEVRELDDKEATVWIDGLDKIAKQRGVNFCVDLSATPYFISRGPDSNTIFPWTVSDFGLTDAIESGLVKVPQLAVRDTTGKEIPGYFNIWRWVMDKLTPAERGARRSSPKPEAVLKWAAQPIAMLGALWDEERELWKRRGEDQRPPVFILVCRNTRIAKIIHGWIGEGEAPAGIPPLKLPELRNAEGRVVTIRVDTKVVQESDSDEAKSDETQWMRLTLDTVGKLDWPRDSQGRPIYPEDFETLAAKLGRGLHPPGRDIRCIVSVGMLTEGWDCNTVTHIIGLRPFMSQLLCEQVVGRGLRRASYRPGEDDRLSEEVAKVFGVPFEVVPFKANAAGPSVPRPKQHHVRALPEKTRFEIRFPRVESYRQAIRNRVTVDFASIAAIPLDPQLIPSQVEMKATMPGVAERPSVYGPGHTATVDISMYRENWRVQELAFRLAANVVKDCVTNRGCDVPQQMLFPQVLAIVQRFLREKVTAPAGTEVRDIALPPYFGWAVERLTAAIRPDVDSGEEPELPVFESGRDDGTTADVEFWTSRDVREVTRSHVNYVVADTATWEQSATFILDTHPVVQSFVKNAGLGFAIPYIHNGQAHDYEPDFIVRLAATTGDCFAIIETKGYDKLAEIKKQAAERWVAAVNAHGGYGQWAYRMVRLEELKAVLDRLHQK